MPTATLDEFDLDIRLAVPDQIGLPRMATSNPHSEPCCSDWTCPIDCKPTVDC